MSEKSKDSPGSKPAKRTTKKVRKKTDEAPKPEVEKTQSEEDVSSSGPDVAGEAAQKRGKRRRGKKGKGGGAESAPNNDVAGGQPEPAVQADEKPGAGEKSREPAPAPRQSHAQRQVRHDPVELAKKAWRIYLAEVSEEGIALINDQDAREISKRCFRLASIFMEEQARHS